MGRDEGATLVLLTLVLREGTKQMSDVNLKMVLLFVFLMYYFSSHTPLSVLSLALSSCSLLLLLTRRHGDLARPPVRDVQRVPQAGWRQEGHVGQRRGHRRVRGVHDERVVHQRRQPHVRWGWLGCTT
jgi:hypothetical protein